MAIDGTDGAGIVVVVGGVDDNVVVVTDDITASDTANGRNDRDVSNTVLGCLVLVMAVPAGLDETR